MAKPKVIIMRKAVGWGDSIGDAISFLDSLDHEVKKQNVCRYYTVVYCTIAKLCDGQNDGTWRGFAHNLRNDSGYRSTHT